jgi:hypothetical protein
LVFYREATSHIDLRLSIRVGCENCAEHRNPKPRSATDHVFSRFALRPSSTQRRWPPPNTALIPRRECRKTKGAAFQQAPAGKSYSG